MRACFGKDDIRVGAALHNMAGLYLSIKPPDFDRAESILREALDVSLSLPPLHFAVSLDGHHCSNCCDSSKCEKSPVPFLLPSVAPVRLQKICFANLIAKIDCCCDKPTAKADMLL